jgi:hypothetical protein
LDRGFRFLVIQAHVPGRECLRYLVGDVRWDNSTMLSYRSH